MAGKKENAGAGESRLEKLEAFVADAGCFAILELGAGTDPRKIAESLKHDLCKMSATRPGGVLAEKPFRPYASGYHQKYQAQAGMQEAMDAEFDDGQAIGGSLAIAKWNLTLYPADFAGPKEPDRLGSKGAVRPAGVKPFVALVDSIGTKGKNLNHRLVESVTLRVVGYQYDAILDEKPQEPGDEGL